MMLDTLIIGQGLAGSLLAMALLKKNKSFLIIDNQHKHSSTKVAAGIMNPIRGKRLTLNWQNQAYLETSIMMYRDLEAILNSPFLHQHQLHRVLITEDEKQAYQKRRQDPKYAPYLNVENTPDSLSAWLNTPNPSFQINPVYRLDTPEFLRSVKKFLEKDKKFCNDKVCYEDIVVDKDLVQWKGYKAKRIIFCEGHQATNNPFLKHLPFKNAKGELLNIQCEGLPENTIFNYGKWLSPTQNKHQYLFGSSSYWEFNDSLPDPEQAEKLTQNLKEFLKPVFTVVQALAGIRPAMKNRKPVFGFLEDRPSVGFINGLGGQGVLNGPHVIKEFYKSGNL